MILSVSLKKDRNQLGLAVLTSDPDNKGKSVTLIPAMPCLALADNAAAAAHHNPTKNPLKPFGNTPTGKYELIVIPAGSDSNAYGLFRRFFMHPLEGDGLTAESEPYNRSGLLVHGGKLNLAYTQWKGLRPTYGCLRFSDLDMLAIGQQFDKMKHKELFTCQVSES